MAYKTMQRDWGRPFYCEKKKKQLKMKIAPCENFQWSAMGAATRHFGQ